MIIIAVKGKLAS